MIIPGERFLLPSSRVQGLLGCWGGGGGGGGEGRLNEIDTCICHRHVKSDIARPTVSRPSEPRKSLIV